MKTFIIGASGLVGGNCLNYFGEQGWENTGTYFTYPVAGTVFFDTLNLDNPANFDVSGFKPDVIVHCGALTHVDYCEQHPEESFEKNVTATKNIIRLAQELGAKLVFISTDYIFDGHDGPYDENAPANPLSVYGKHKWEAEQLVRQASANNIVLRITNVYGDEVRGKNFVSRIIDQAKNGQRLTLKLPIDQYATPINAHDIARCLYVLLKDNKSGVYNIASSDFLNRVELAMKILAYFPQAEYDLFELTTEALQQPAPRPLKGGLKNDKFLQEYPDFQFTTVDDYVRKVVKAE